VGGFGAAEPGAAGCIAARFPLTPGFLCDEVVPATKLPSPVVVRPTGGYRKSLVLNFRQYLWKMDNNFIYFSLGVCEIKPICRA
jgi:hypothetical protein